jgi:hypothetical protein
MPSELHEFAFLLVEVLPRRRYLVQGHRGTRQADSADAGGKLDRAGQGVRTPG